MSQVLSWRVARTSDSAGTARCVFRVLVFDMISARAKLMTDLVCDGKSCQCSADTNALFRQARRTAWLEMSMPRIWVLKDRRKRWDRSNEMHPVPVQRSRMRKCLVSGSTLDAVPSGFACVSAGKSVGNTADRLCRRWCARYVVMAAVSGLQPRISACGGAYHDE